MKAWPNRLVMLLVCLAAMWMLLPPTEKAFSQVGMNQLATSAASGQKPWNVVSTMLPDGTQQLIIADSETRTLAVYHVDPQQGRIQLTSVRNVIYDLRMEQFNAQTPLPSELRQVEP